MNVIVTSIYQAPCGELLLGALEDKLCLCDWLTGQRTSRCADRICRLLSAELREGEAPVLSLARQQLDEYFALKRREFSVPLLPVGTDFQKQVWASLLTIPYGQTASYGEQARRIGRPSAVRAVAGANGANPLSVFVPCHRVIGSDRSLTGYGGGLDTKRYLLQLETNGANLALT